MPSTETLNTITRWLNYVVAIPFLMLGIIGAILTVIIFTRRHQFWRNASAAYLLAGAALTGIHLPSIYTQSILVHGFGLGVFNTNKIACQEHNYLLYMTTVAAISFPCWAAFDQFASTCRNARFRNRWSSIHVVRCAIVGTVIFWTVVYLPVIFVSDVVNGLCVMTASTYTTFNTFFFTPLVYSVGPLTVMILCTIGTMRNLRSIQGVQRQSHITKQVRRMLIPQMVVLGLSGIPFGFQGIYFELTSQVVKDEFRLALENFFSQVILLLYHCNYVCPFYIYLYMSIEVRKDLKKLIFKGLRRNHIEPTVNTINTETCRHTLNTTRHPASKLNVVFQKAHPSISLINIPE